MYRGHVTLGLVSDWNEAYTARYDEWAAAMTEDVAFYVSLAREADGPVVELAVGTGRVAVPVTEAIGRRVTGIDASPGMLTQCRARAAAAGVALDLIEADMRTVFKRVAASLQPGGRFAWNALAFDHTILATGVVNSMWWATKNEWLA